MPLTRIDIPSGKSAEYRVTLREVVYETLNTVMGVPDDDRFEVITEHDAANLYVSPDYLGIERSADAIVIQITLNAGRPVEMKRAFYAALVANLNGRLGIRREDVVVSLLEVGKEDWSFGNGLATYAEG
jgi:phenylpyruvate tautomerase PptA (4-oxalocrotonate tautomerase family)